jgi:diaminopimelate epimerase
MRFAKAHAYGNDFLYVQKDAVQGDALDVFAREIFIGTPASAPTV